MSAPDELVEAVAQAIHTTMCECGEIGALATASASQPTFASFAEVARAVLSVPALAEVIARDAKVREIVGEWATVSQIVRHSPSDQAMAKIVAAHLGAVDDSDIMPGSEFDGPVVL